MKGIHGLPLAVQGSPRSRLALFHPRLLRTRHSAPEEELLILFRDLEVVWEGVRMENDVILEVGDTVFVFLKGSEVAFECESLEEAIDLVRLEQAWAES